MTTHLIVYNREQDQDGTACGIPQKDVEQFTLTERTGDHRRVTCPDCRAYIRRTGDGPEGLKALLRL